MQRNSNAEMVIGFFANAKRDLLPIEYFNKFNSYNLLDKPDLGAYNCVEETLYLCIS